MANPILSYAVNRLIAEDHPTIYGKRCVNSLQKREPCDKCVRACPEQAILNPEKGEADWDKCTDCGICVTACPPRAISASSSDYKKALKALSKKSEKLTIACAEQDASADYKPRCLAALSWEMLCAVALVKDLHILKPDCSACGHRELLPLFDAALKRAREFLGPELYDARVTVSDSFAAEESDVSRREMMQMLVKGIKTGVASALPETEDDKPDSMFYRRLLNSRLAQLAKKEGAAPAVTWRAPRFNSNCWGCGICQKLCPNGAIKVHTDDSGSRYMLHYPSRCVECGLCATVCLHGGINGYDQRLLKDPLKFSATKVPSASCPECGGAVKPENAGKLCTLCQIKAKKNKRRG